MKINKLKAISIAVCYLIASLWSEAQCMDPPQIENVPIRNDLTEIIPTGSIMAFAGEVAPHGWLLCNGQQHSSVTYPELYEVVKEKYARENIRAFLIERNRAALMEKTFYVPDLRGRVIVGVDGGAGRVTANNILGASSGEERHQLTIAELAKHPHKMFDAISGSRALPTTAVLSGTNPNLAAFGFTEPEGGDQPHNNMQPYTCLNYIINTGIGNRQNNPQIKNEIIEQLQRQISYLNITLANIPVMPIGAIMEYSGTVGIPANFLECNGAAVSRVNYAQLFANIGTTYGIGDNVTTFNLPDKRGRISVGIDSNNNTGGHVTNATAPFITLGGTFGEETHQLTVPELARHTHPCQVMHAPGGYWGRGNAGNMTNEATGSTGENQPHNNMQPSMFMRFYIRAE